MHGSRNFRVGPRVLFPFFSRPHRKGLVFPVLIRWPASRWLHFFRRWLVLRIVFAHSLASVQLRLRPLNMPRKHQTSPTGTPPAGLSCRPPRSPLPTAHPSCRQAGWWAVVGLAESICLESVVHGMFLPDRTEKQAGGGAIDEASGCYD